MKNFNKLFLVSCLTLSSLYPCLAEDEKSLNEKVETQIEDMPPQKAAERIITINDKNGDGKLSRDEVDSVFRVKRFSKVDTNADGLLSKEELTISYKNAALAKAQRPKEASDRPGHKIKKGASKFFGGLFEEVGDIKN